ncbi:methyl-accepting chemotaxis protein [Melittangium boletus]|uniref:methyl-accepting chemotaxis protein n=1 Tax=Melittangium boletus TaxID=83453 RepID=UPI003DA4BB15
MSPHAPANQSTVGIGPKFTFVTAAVSVAIAVLLSGVATQRLRTGLLSSTVSEGKAIAHGFTRAADHVSTDAGSMQSLVDSYRGMEGLAYVYVRDSSAKVIAHSLAGDVPVELTDINAASAESFTTPGEIKAVPEADVFLDGSRVSVADVAAPLSGGRVLHVGIKHENVNRQVGELGFTLAMLSMLIVLGGVAASYVLSRSIVGPLRELTDVAAHIVDSGDLTRPIQVSAAGEVGQLAHSFSQMVERLRSVVQNLQQASEALNASTEQLNASSAEQSQTVARQASALQETQVTAQEIRQTSLLASQKADAVLSVAERADELSRTGEESLEQTLAGLNDIRTQVQEIAQKILELGERTVQIGSITQTVKDLADQSNMLALNAAIEAVRSGENGKGFGVVAREIRALADQSIESTDRVRELLDDIGNSVSIAVRSTEKGQQRMEAGLEQVRTYGKNLRELSTINQDNAAAVRQIAAAVGQQNVGINQITTAVSDLSKMMDETVARIGATGEAATTLQIISDQLSSAVKAYRVQ